VGGLASLAHAAATCFGNARDSVCRPALKQLSPRRRPEPSAFAFDMAFGFPQKRKGSRCFALEAPLSLPTGTRPAKGNAYMDVRIRRGEAGTPNLADPSTPVLWREGTREAGRRVGVEGGEERKGKALFCPLVAPSVCKRLAGRGAAASRSLRACPARTRPIK